MKPNTLDDRRDRFMLTGGFANQGYDWWWHNFTAHHAETGEERSFFIEYFTCNPALGGAEPILGQLPANRAAGIRPSYLMVKAGCWGTDAKQLHRFFGWDDVEIGMGAPFYVSAEECFACETNLLGSVTVSPEDAAAHPEWMCDAGQMIWDLQLDKQMAFNVGYGASVPMSEAQGFEMYWHAQGIKTLVSGDVWLDGEHYVVDPETSFGYSDKNWGSNFTSPWVWLSSWDMVSSVTGRRLENSAFEIGGGRPKVFGLALDRKLLGCMLYEGQEFEFNFSKPWTGNKTYFDCDNTLPDKVIWHVEQENNDAILITDIECPKSQMLLVNYESPDGHKRYNNLWNGGTGTGRLQLLRKLPMGKVELIDDIRVGHVGCEYGEYDAD